MTKGAARILSSLGLAVVLLGGCSEGEVDRAGERAERTARDAADKAADELGDVDWDKYGDGLKRRLDKLAEDADCSALRAELAKRESNDQDLTRYIKRQIRRAC